jgi:hypothetical protein
MDAVVFSTYSDLDTDQSNNENESGSYSDYEDDSDVRQSGSGDNGDGDDDDTSASADASQDPSDSHRAALGSVLQSLQSRGIDVDALAQDAGVDSADVNALEGDDLTQLTQYVQQAHPELTQQVFSRFPLAQSLLGDL